MSRQHGETTTMKTLYIFLTRSGTLLSNLVYRLTGAQYTHISLAFDEDLSTLYSSTRKNGYTMFPAGPSREYLNRGVFLMRENIPCALYALEVTDEAYIRAKRRTQHMMHHGELYRFNSLGLLLATIVCMLTGGLPIGVLCMLVIPLMYICGCVETPAAALAGFQNQSAFFMLASFGLTCAVTRVPLSRRLMRGIITKEGRNAHTILLAIMLCCGRFLPSFPILPPARRSSRWCWISSASMKMRTSASAPAAACSSPCPPLP